jgi:hypothetical protein
MDPISIAMGLAQFAPAIIKWVSGSDKAAEVADKVVDVAKAVTGQTSGEAALEAIKADPNLVLTFRTKLLEMEADLDKAYLADRQDARRHNAAIVQAKGGNHRANLMVLLDAIGLLACLFVLAFYREHLSGELVALVSTIASIFGLCLRDAHQFEFGSSRGSQEKNEALFGKLGK